MDRRSVVIWLGLFVILTTALCAGGNKESDRLIGPEEAFEMIAAGEAVMVDVRTLGSYAESHITGALSIPYSDIPARASQFADQPKIVITYCDCPAEETSQAAAIELREAGIHNVRVLQGGIRGWRSAGLPVSSGNRP